MVYFLGAESIASRSPPPACDVPRGHSAHAESPITITSDSRRSKVEAVYNRDVPHYPGRTYNEHMLCVDLALAAALACCQQTLPAGAKVSYTNRAARASVVLPELAKLANFPLTMSPEMAGEVLLISVHDVPLAAVMSRIAAVTSGEWRQEGNTYRLVPDQELRRREDQAYLARQTTAWKDLIADRQSHEQTAAQLSGGLRAAQVPSVVRATQAEQSLITSLVQCAGPESLANIAPGGRAVYSTEPTPMQRRFGRGAEALINKFIQLRDASVGNPPASLADSLKGADAVRIQTLRIDYRNSLKIGEVSKALLSVEWFGLDPRGCQFQLRLFDHDGSVSYFIQSSPYNEAKPPAPRADETPVDFCEDSRRLVTTVADKANREVAATKDFRDKLRRPDLFDPLSYTQTDELKAWARSLGKPLVADIADNWRVKELYEKEELRETVEAVGRDLTTGRVMRFSDDGSFLVVMPTSPPESRAIRLDRLALTELLRAGEDKVVPSLDDRAAFADRTPEPVLRGLAAAYVTLFPGDESGTWAMLRFYAHTPPADRARLARAGRLSIGSLSAEQRADLEEVVYGRLARLSLVEDSRSKDPRADTRRSVFFQFGAGDYRQEPTEALPNGLPPDGYIDMTGTPGQMVLWVTSDGDVMPGGFGPLAPEGLAMMEMYQKHLWGEEWYKMMSGAGPTESDLAMPEFRHLRLGDSTYLEFTIHLTPQVFTKQRLGDDRFDKGAPLLTEDTLPADVQRLISEQIAMMTRMFQSSGAGASKAVSP